MFDNASLLERRLLFLNPEGLILNFFLYANCMLNLLCWGSADKVIASYTNANPRERYELVGNKRGPEQGKNFPVK